MNLYSRFIGVLGFIACAFSSNVAAQAYQYHVYLDADLRESTGCTVTGSGQSFAGADYRLTTVVSGSPPRATGRSLSACSGGAFPALAPTAVNYPVGLNNGVPVPGGQADVIESSVARSALPGVEPQVRVAFAAQSESGSIDVLFTSDGLVGGTPMILGLPLSIPTIGFLAALILALALSFGAFRTLKKNRGLARMLLVCASFSIGFAAWAANHVVDGLISDWAGVSPLGTDPVNDSAPPLTATDIVAGFGADEASTLFFRLDVMDAENRPPVAVSDAYSVLEDQALSIAAPGVLANDSDPDGNPITAQLVAGPTRGTLTLNANGGFLYTPNANINGSDSFTYNAFDGQVASQTPATVTITITPVNDAPVFTAGPNQTVLEDAGAQTVDPWATGLSDGDPDATQALTFVVTNNTNPALFAAGGAPAISPTGVLSYTPAANTNGTATITLRLDDDGGTANGGINQSATQTFSISVTAVNDAPTFTAGPNQAVSEDAGAQTVPGWATAMDDGDPELTQALSFTATVTGTTSNLAFSAAPAIDAVTGNLTYTASPNTNGVATIEVRLVDNGSGVAPNVNTSAPQTFTISVAAVNDAPSFLAGPNQTVNEDAGPQTVNPWATALDDGDPEVAQALSFAITNNSNAALFAAGGAPAVSPTGVLSYTPAANANGSATITLRIQDDGSNTPPNSNQSATQTFTITVSAINDAPSFGAGPNQTVNEDAGAQTVNPWATAISAGPPDELAQSLSFNVTGNTNAALFAAGGLPAISPAGVLTYTPAANASGTASITLTLSDDGPNAPPPNANTSAAQTFTITVNAVNDPPVNSVPGAQQTGDTTPLVFSTANANAISVADLDAAAGTVQMSFGTGAPANGTLTLANPGSVLTISGNGTALVTATGTIAQLNNALNGPAGSLTYTPVAGTSATRTITIISNDQGNTGSGGALIDTDTISVNVDGPPVVTSTPANAAVIANNAPITVNFSEPVDVVAGITLACGGPNLITGGNTGNGVSSLALAYTAPLPAGSCTLSVPAASVTDVDSIDPPNNPVATYTATFTVDAAPAVTTTTPANGSTTANNVALAINFSEPVDATGAAVTLNCGGPITLGAITGTGVTSLNPTYTAPLPAGACTLTVVAAQINDSDLTDPPANPVANTVINFTVDAAPVFVSATPAAAAIVGTGQSVSFTYDEPVTDLGGAITLNCGANVPGAVTGSGTETLTFTPTNPLSPGASCTATAIALQIGDADAFDPPQNPAANVVRSFTVDTAPDFVSSVPANGATNVAIANNITVTFSEAVNFTETAFTLECPAGTAVPFTVSGSGTNTATIDPTPATLPVNTLCVVTVNDALVSDVDLADPPNAGAGSTTISFTTVNDNPPTVTTNPANGATNIALNSNITVNFNEPVTLAGAWFQLACPISGVRSSTGELTGTGIVIIENTPDLVYTIDPSVNLANGEACTITIDSANAVDNDAIDPPNELDGDASGDTTDGDADDYVAQFTTPDIAPTVTSTPAAGATVPNTQAVTLNFSEPVNVAAGAITFNCGAAVTFTPALPQSGISTLTLTPSAPLPDGANCSVTLESTLITDVDAIDPPNQLDGNSSGDLIDGDADDFTLTFTVDAPPAVTSAEVEVVNVFTALPLGVGVFADSDTNLRLSFSEAVNPTANWASLTCSNSGTQSVGGGTLAVTNADPVFTLNPATNLTPGESCTLTVFAVQVDDDDAIDPPGTLAADASYTFSVRDAAPQVLSPTVPLNAATVPDTQVVTLNFSEVVDLAAGSVLFDCGGAVAFTPALPQSNVSSITLTPSAALPAGAACTVTLESTLVTDDDALDPPDQLDGDASNDTNDGDADDFVLSFNVDAAPSVLATAPANGALNVSPTSAISIDFSESVSFSTLAEPAPGNPSFDLICDGSPAGFTVTSASPSDPVLLNPVDSDVAGRSCVLTVVASQIADSDAIDPPNNMAANFSATIGFSALAFDDAYTVTPHLTLNIPTTGVQGGGTAANDILGAGAVTGFGFAPACTGTAAGAQLDAGAANGRLTLNANGSFAYEPPAGLNAITRTFCYTVTGGDTANIVFTVQNQARVWFVDASAAAGGNGTQAQPFNALTGAGSFDAVAADGNGDTIYLEGAQTGGLTLRSGQRVIGGGSTMTIAAFSGVAPIAGSAFPALSGSAPVITCSGVACLRLNNSGAANTHSLRGFTIGDSGATGTDIGGTTFGTLTVAELTLTGSGTTMSLATGTLNGTLLDLNANAGSGSLTLSAVGGTWSVQNQVDLTGNLGAFSITDMPAGGSVTLTGGLNSALGNGTIVLTNNASPVNLGNILLNTTGSMTVSNSSGVTTVTNGSITTPFNSLLVTNSALNITLATMTSTGGAGPGLSATNFTGSINIASGAITNSNAGFSQVVLNNNTGTFSFGGSVAKSTAGRLIDISGGTGNIDFSGTLTCQTSCGTGAGNEGLRVTSRTGGTVNFSGGIKGFSSTAANPAISLTNNGGSTINFSSGGLTITTTSGTGFSATGGGTVTVQGTGNTIASTTGTALNVGNTTIGAAGLTFQSISSNGAGSGIVLNATGASGGLTVTGNSAGLCGGSVGSGPPASAAATTAPVVADCTGGTIQNSTGPGIILTETSNVSLTRIRVINGGNDGVQGTNVTGFSLISSYFDNNGNANNENGLDFGDSSSLTPDGLHGTGVITNSAILNSYYNGVSIRNIGGTALTSFNVSGSQFRSLPANGDSNDNVFMEAGGTAAMAISVSGSHFSSIEGDHFQAAASNSGGLTVNFTNNTLTGGHSTPLGQGITINAATGVALGGYSGTVTYDINGNHINNAASNGASIVLGTSSAAALFRGRVRNNVIGTAGVALSCSTQANGLSIEARGNGTHTSEVTNNTIRQCFDRGILSEAGDGNPVLNLTVTSNTIDQQVAASAREAIQTNYGISSTNVFGEIDTPVVCLQLGGAGGLSNTFSHGAGAPDDFRLRKRFEATVRLPGYAGGTGQDAGSLGQVVAFIQGQNVGSAGEPGSAAASGTGGGYTGGAACPLPP